MPIIHPLCAVLSLVGAGPPRGAPDRIDPFPADLQDGLGTAMALVALGSAFEVVFDAGAGGAGVTRTLASGHAALWRDAPLLRSLRALDAAAQEQHHVLFCSFAVEEWVPGWTGPSGRRPLRRDEL